MGVEDIIGAAAGLKGSSSLGLNKIIVWILILVIIFGFGNGKNCCNVKCGECEEREECCSSHHKKCRNRCNNQCCNVNNGFGSFFGNAGFGQLLGNNGLFILVIIGLLVLCREKRETSTTH